MTYFRYTKNMSNDRLSREHAYQMSCVFRSKVLGGVHNWQALARAKTCWKEIQRRAANVNLGAI